MQRLIFPILLFLPILLGAQPAVSKTEAFATSGDVTVEGILREPGSNNLMVVYRDYISLGPTGKITWAVDVFSSDLKRIVAGKPEKIEFSDGDDVKNGITASLGGSATILFHRYVKKDKKTLIYLAKVESGGKIGNLKLFGALAGKAEKYSTPVFAYSMDSAYLLLMRPFTEEDIEERPSYIVIDRSWNIVHEGKLAFPADKEAEYLIGLPVIGNDASIWMPVWTKGQGEETKQEIWKWKEAKAEPQRIDISISTDCLITGMRLQQSASDQSMYVGGLYAASSKKAHKAIFNPPSPPDDDHPEQGTFVAKLDVKDCTILSKSANPFNALTFRYWARDQEDIKKGKGIDLIRPVSVHPQPDGSVWVDAEEYFVPPIEIRGTTGALNTGGNPRYGPALAVLYTAGGEVGKEIVIAKRTWVSINRHASHFFTAGPKGAFLLYNDNGENIQDPPERAEDLKYGGVPNGSSGIPIIQKQACTAMYYADKNSKGKPQCLFKFRETEYWLEPRTFIETVPDVYIFACEGKDGQYGLLKVEW